MRNAAAVLGITGGVLALIVGFFGFGYTEFIDRHGEIEGLARQVDNVGLIRAASFAAPILAIAGGAMARYRALWAGGLLLGSGALFYAAFGFGVFTMFPLGMMALGGIMALAAGRPDEPKAHF